MSKRNMAPVRRGSVVAACALVVSLTGCGDATKDQSPTSRDGVISAWKKAGLELTTVAVYDSKKLGGGDCVRGMIKAIPTTLCTFPDATIAESAQPAGLQIVGKTTGAALVSGAMLLVVADPSKADPQGRTINDITKVFRRGGL